DAGLTESVRKAIDRFVAVGGTLLTEHDAGLGLASTDVATAAARRGAMRSAYFRVRPQDGARFPSLAATTLLPCGRDYLYLGDRVGGERLFGLVPPDLYGAPEQTVIELETEHPGLLLRAHGQGRIAYFPWAVGRVLHDMNPAPLDGLARDMVAQLAP